MNISFLLIGGNEGDSRSNLGQACVFMEKAGIRILQRSALYQTAAWGKTDQPNFLNQALKISSTLSPLPLLETLLAIEEKMGRRRTERYGPRTIDIDILFINDMILREPGLIVPHPEIPYRRFVLTPMAEIAPNFIHPVLQRSISNLLAGCPDKLEVKKITNS